MRFNLKQGIWVFALAITFSAVGAPRLAAAGQSLRGMERGLGHDKDQGNMNSPYYKQGLRDGQNDAMNHRAGQYLMRPKNDADRRAYEYGYDQGYQNNNRRPGNSNRNRDAKADHNSRDIASQSGFQDGVNDGMNDRQTRQSNRPTKRTNYRNANHNYSPSLGNKNQYMQLYRQAYERGYQEGYSGQGYNHPNENYNRQDGPYVGVGSSREPRNGACFYIDANYSGDRFCMSTGENQQKVGSPFDDNISSIWVFGNAQVIVHQNDKFGGKSRTFTSDVLNLESLGFNDRITSIEVK